MTSFVSLLLLHPSPSLWIEQTCWWLQVISVVFLSRAEVMIKEDSCKVSIKQFPSLQNCHILLLLQPPVPYPIVVLHSPQPQFGPCQSSCALFSNCFTVSFYVFYYLRQETEHDLQRPGPQALTNKCSLVDAAYLHPRIQFSNRLCYEVRGYLGNLLGHGMSWILDVVFWHNLLQ